ncbi:hypothetical protein LPJ53_003427 [Coemansia erecta]|uniref:DUF4246 domain-containing protein n=1 Tax=Coemansia erecta TaxID=147472 RepID=A0A9W7Y237_9FUNG|nr:hypothetical protein LPJ53_003427 [Coemansia erecta]
MGLRQDPKWIERISNEKTRREWMAEFKQTTGALSDKQVDYIFAELEYYARLQTAAGNRAQLTDVDMVWETMIDDCLRGEFMQQVTDALEGVPQKLQDWTTVREMEPTESRHFLNHTTDTRLKSNCRVLRLIDPSLYTLLFDKTPLLSQPMSSPQEALQLSSLGSIPGSHEAWKSAINELNDRMAGKNDYVPNSHYMRKLNPDDRHWLPADIFVADDGSVEFRSYINNLHPIKYPKAYNAIAKVVSRCIPVLEQVLTDWKYVRNLRIPYDIDKCVHADTLHPNDPEFCHPEDSDSDFDFDAAAEDWDNNLVKTVPEPEEFEEPERPLTPHSLFNRNLQVVIKMDNFYLTPENKCFPDEEWQGDGTASEQIIATAVYCYDIENVSELRIEFRESICEVGLGSYVEARAYHFLFEVFVHSENFFFTQSAGSADLKQGSLVCHPNIYQHQISSFSLKDESKPGHVKTMTLYFVDPAIRVVSTALVPPQQQHWWIPSILDTPLLAKFPAEIQSMIISSVDSPISFDTAAKARKILDDRALVSNDDRGRFDIIVHDGDFL